MVTRLELSVPPGYPPTPNHRVGPSWVGSRQGRGRGRSGAPSRGDRDWIQKQRERDRVRTVRVISGRWGRGSGIVRTSSPFRGTSRPGVSRLTQNYQDPSPCPRVADGINGVSGSPLQSFSPHTPNYSLWTSGVMGTRKLSRFEGREGGDGSGSLGGVAIGWSTGSKNLSLFILDTTDSSPLPLVSLSRSLGVNSPGLLLVLQGLGVPEGTGEMDAILTRKIFFGPRVRPSIVRLNKWINIILFVRPLIPFRR